jgi:hypothetical protein
MRAYRILLCNTQYSGPHNFLCGSCARKENWAHISERQTPDSPPAFVILTGDEPWIKPGVWRPEIWALFDVAFTLLQQAPKFLDFLFGLVYLQVDRVTRNAFKLFQVREQLKTTKACVVQLQQDLLLGMRRLYCNPEGA